MACLCPSTGSVPEVYALAMSLKKETAIQYNSVSDNNQEIFDVENFRRYKLFSSLAKSTKISFLIFVDTSSNENVFDDKFS